MIKLKDILLESTAPDIFIPRKIEDRVVRLIHLYVRNGSKGELDLRNRNLIELPEILKDITVDRYFDCSHNNLISLKNSPKSVGGSFICNSNELTSLEGAPKYVSGNFICNNNHLTSLKGAPNIINGNFACNGNELTSLAGAPETVDKTFSCMYNKLTSLQGAPKTVGGDFWCSDNPGKFTKAQVRTVCNVKGVVVVAV